MDDLLTDHVAVVTGGASGIGREICLRFADHGADVVVADRRADPREGGTPTHERVAAETDRDARFVECDVADRTDLDAAMDAAADLGGLDVLVNNAGILQSGRFLDVTEAEYDRLLDVNVKGTFFAAQAAARRMVDDGGGSIVNVSSVAGLQGTGGYATYCTSKGAVRLLTYALADELGPEGIRVNAVHPGIVETAMTTDDVALVGTDAGERYREALPARRFGDPGDVADATLYLASDLADYVTGESLVVDGGMTSTG